MKTRVTKDGERCPSCRREVVGPRTFLCLTCNRYVCMGCKPWKNRALEEGCYNCHRTKWDKGVTKG